MTKLKELEMKEGIELKEYSISDLADCCEGFPKLAIKKFKSWNHQEGGGWSCDFYMDKTYIATVEEHGLGAPLYVYLEDGAYQGRIDALVEMTKDYPYSIWDSKNYENKKHWSHISKDDMSLLKYDSLEQIVSQMVEEKESAKWLKRQSKKFISLKTTKMEDFRNSWIQYKRRYEIGHPLSGEEEMEILKLIAEKYGSRIVKIDGFRNTLPEIVESFMKEVK
mgnify:CR=1 FL=1